MKKWKQYNALKIFTLVFVMLIGMLPITVQAETGNAPMVLHASTEPIVWDLSEQSLDAQPRMTFDMEGATDTLLSDGEYDNWIDRLDLADAEYAQEFYCWLEDNAVWDSTVEDNCYALIDPTQGDVLDGGYAYNVVTFEESISYEATSDTTQALASEKVQEKANENFATVGTYIQAVYDAFDRDHPEVFWLSGMNRMSSPGFNINISTEDGTNWTATFSQSIYFYLLDTDFDIRATDYQNVDIVTATITERDNLVQSILEDVDEEWNYYQTVRYFNDSLTERNCYNSSDDLNNIGHDCRECISALEGRTDSEGPVCEAYARALKVLCDKADIPCILVSGNAASGENTEANMWNYVADESRTTWFAVDVTWNDPTVADVTDVESGYENRDYLMIGSDTVVNENSFGTSHTMTNVVSDGGVAFTNQPELNAEAYATAVIEFDANGGECSVPELIITYTETDTEKTIPGIYDATREGYILTGWNTQADGTGTGYEPEENVNGVIAGEEILYAQWEEIQEYVFTYHANNGTEETTTETYYEGDSQMLIENPFEYWENEQITKVFVGWTLNEDGSGTVYEEWEDVEFAESIDFYAKWAPIYTMTLKANGSGEEDYIYKFAGGVVMELDIPFYRDGYRLSGYSTTAGESDVQYYAYEDVIFDEDTTLYAQWEAWEDKLYLGGQELSEGQYMDNTGAIGAVEPSGGYAYYKNGTLTLKDFTISEGSYTHEVWPDYICTAALYQSGNLNLVLEGENTIVNIADDMESVEADGIAAAGTISIQGNGSLYVEASHFDLYAPYVAIISASVEMKSGHWNIYALRDLSITDAEVDCMPMDAASEEVSYYCGVYLEEGDASISNSTVEFYGTDTELAVNGMLTVDGGIVTVIDTNRNVEHVISAGEGIELKNVGIRTPQNGMIETSVNEYTDKYGDECVDTLYYVVDVNGDCVSQVVISAVSDSVGETLGGYSISLDGNINVNFHFLLTDALANSQSAYALLTLPNGTTKEVLISEATKKNVVKENEDGEKETVSYHVFTAEVAAKEMASDIKVQIIADENTKSEEYVYTVKQYAEHILMNESTYREDYETAYGEELGSEYVDKLMEMVRSMLHYGAYAQNYFEYNTSKPANQYLVDRYCSDGVADVVADQLAEYEMSASCCDELGEFIGASLVLKSNTYLKVYFKPAEGVDIEDLNFRINKQEMDEEGNAVDNYTELTAVASGDYYVLRLEDIKAYDLDSAYTFEVTDASNTVEGLLTYNPMSYCYAVLYGDGELYTQELKELAAALYLYNLAADDYMDSYDALINA